MAPFVQLVDAENSDQIQLGRATYEKAKDRLTGASGEDLILRAQSAHVLRLLVANLGQLVTRDDLHTAVWPNTAVTDDSLTQCIADIRRALGDQHHAVLRTVPKRGYLLAATSCGLQGVAPAEPVAALSQIPKTEIRAEDRRQEPAGFETTISARLDPRDVQPTIAVLPLRTGGNIVDPMSGALVAEEIAHALGESNDLNVISQMSSGHLSRLATDLTAMNQRLHIDFVLSGVVHASGSRLRIQIELADTESHHRLWSDRIETSADLVILDPTEVNRIVSRIRNGIMLNEIKRFRSRPMAELKLFTVMHSALVAMHRFSPKEFERARSRLDYVAEQAPHDPTPLAWLARWHVLRVVQGWSGDIKGDTATALDFTARALDLDPDHALALVCEGHVLGHLARRLDEAEHRYDLALSSNPNDAQGRALRGTLKAFRDNGPSARRDAERALHLTPYDPHRFFFLALAALANIAAEDYARAVTLAQESLRLNRTHVSTLRTLAVAQASAGEILAARDTVQELLRQQPGFRVSTWQRESPGADYQMGHHAASMLLSAGAPQ